MQWPFLFVRNGMVMLRGSVPTVERICQADGQPDRKLQVRQLQERTLDADPQDLNMEGTASWSLPDGTFARYRNFMGRACIEQGMTEVTAPDGKVTEAHGMFVPFPGGYCGIMHQAPGRLTVRREGQPTVEWRLVGEIRMMMPVFDDPTCILLDIVEVRQDALPPSARHLLRLAPNLGVRKQATYLLRTNDLATFRIDFGFPEVLHASLLLNRGLAIVTTSRISPQDGSNIEVRHHMVPHYKLVPASPGWVPVERKVHAATKALVTAAGDQLLRTTKSSKDVSAQFFDPDTPCWFEGCEELRRRYEEDLQKAGGNQCPSCVRDSLRATTLYKVREILQAANPVLSNQP